MGRAYNTELLYACMKVFLFPHFAKFCMNVLWVPSLSSWTVCILDTWYLYWTKNVGLQTKVNLYVFCLIWSCWINPNICFAERYERIQPLPMHVLGIFLSVFLCLFYSKERVVRDSQCSFYHHFNLKRLRENCPRFVSEGQLINTHMCYINVYKNSI